MRNFLAVQPLDRAPGARAPGGHRAHDTAKFLTKIAAARFNFTRMSDKDVAAESAGGPTGTLEDFRCVQTSTSSPPGPKDSWLGEALVHSEDIRPPLQIGRSYPLPWVTRAIEFYAKSNAIVGGKRRVAGLTLKASDIDWSHGLRAVEGPALSLLLAATGRSIALEELSGPGLDTLRSR